jgi:hypothetical protein
MVIDPKKYPSLYLEIGLWVNDRDSGGTAERAHQALYGKSWGASATTETLPHTLSELASIIREKQAEALEEAAKALQLSSEAGAKGIPWWTAGVRGAAETCKTRATQLREEQDDDQ